MFSMSSVTRAWLIAILLSGCANETAPLSSETQEAIAEEQNTDTPLSNTRISDEPEDVTVEEIPAPKEWPACWLSSRLSTATAMLAVEGGWDASSFKRDNGRTEFTGKAANPLNRGDCIFNWFGQDNPDEPWVEMLWNEMRQDPQDEFSRDKYEAVVTCTAESTPDCTCMTTVPKTLDGNQPFLVGDCVREDDIGGHIIYEVRDPELKAHTPANGRCDVANASIKSLMSQNRRGEIMRMEDDDADVTTGEDTTCRVDVEPFSPRDDERDWYGDEIRDWAVVTCEDENTSCRSYAIFYKSSREDGLRSSSPETGLMLICNDGACEQVW